MSFCERVSLRRASADLTRINVMTGDIMQIVVYANEFVVSNDVTLSKSRVRVASFEGKI